MKVNGSIACVPLWWVPTSNIYIGGKIRANQLMNVNKLIVYALLLLFCLGSIQTLTTPPYTIASSPPLGKNTPSLDQQTTPFTKPNPQPHTPESSGVDTFSGSAAPLSGILSTGCTTTTTSRYMTEASTLEVTGPWVNPPTDGTPFDYVFTSYVGALWGQRSEWFRDPNLDSGIPWTEWDDGNALTFFGEEDGVTFGEIASPNTFSHATYQGYFSQSFTVPPGWFGDTYGLFPDSRTSLTVRFCVFNWAQVKVSLIVDGTSTTLYHESFTSTLDTWSGFYEQTLHFDSLLSDHASTVEVRLHAYVTGQWVGLGFHRSGVRFDSAMLWSLHKLQPTYLDLALSSEQDPTKQYAVANGADWGTGQVSVADTCASGDSASYRFTRSASKACDWPVAAFNHFESMQASWQREAETTFTITSGALLADWGIAFCSQIEGSQWQPRRFMLNLPTGWSNYQFSPTNPSGTVFLSETMHTISVNNPAEGKWAFSAHSANQLATHGAWSATSDTTQTYATEGDQFNVTISYAAGPTFAKYRIVCDGTQVYEQPSGDLYLPVDGGGDSYLTEVVAGALEGWYDVVAFAVTPQTGEVGARTIHNVYLIDCTIPLLSFSSPPNGAHVAAGKSCPLVWQQTDEGNPSAGLAASNLTITGPNNYHHTIITTETGSQTHQWSVPTIEGTYTVNLTAIDVVGNWASLLRTLHVDATSPLVTIESSFEETYLRQTVIVEVSANDLGINPSGVLWVALSVDGVLLHNTTATPPYQFPWDTQGWSDGNHTLTAIVSDGVGWIATHSLTLSVDNTKPNIVITAPLEGGYYSTNELLAVWEGTDNTGIAYYQVYLDGELLANTTDTTFLLSNLTESIQTLTVEAFDLAGNHQSTPHTFTLDTTSPILDITAPLEGSHTSSANPIIQWSASDATAGLATFTVFLDGTQVAVLDGSYRQYTLANLTDASHTILVQAFDHVGNTASRNITFLVDNTAPQLEVYLPVTEAGFTDNTTLDVVVFVTDRYYTIIELYIDGVLSGVAENTNETTFTTTVTATAHTLLVKATDIAGNRAEYTETFTVDLENPLVRIDTPTAGTLLTGMVEITLFLADANMREAVLLLDGEVVLFRFYSSGSHTLTLDTSTLPDGDHTLTLIGYDLALRTCQAERSVTLCNHPPTILTARVSTLYGNATICDTDTLSVQVTLNATYPDDPLIITATLDTDGDGIPESYALSCYGGVWMTSGIIGPLSGMRSYTVTVIARSPAGTSSEILEFSVVSTTQLTLSVPADLTTQQTTQLSATLTTSTGQPVAHQLIRFFLDGVNGSSLLGEAYTNAEGVATLAWQVSQSLAGVVTLRAEFAGTQLQQAGTAEAQTTILNVFASLDNQLLGGCYLLMNGPWIIIGLAGLRLLDPKFLLFLFAGLGAQLPGDISFLTFHQQIHHHAQTNLNAYAQDLQQFFQALNLTTFHVETRTTISGSFLLVGYRTATDPSKHTIDAARLSLAEMLRFQAIQQQLGDELYYLGQGDLQRWRFDSNPLVEDEFLQSALESTQLLSVEASPFATTPDYQLREEDWSRVKPYLTPTQVFEGSLSMGWFVPTFLFYGEVVVRGWDLGYESLDKYLENTILAVIHQRQVEAKVAETMAELARLRDEAAINERINEARDSLLSTAESMYKDAGAETWEQVGREAQRLFDELIHNAKVRNLEEASYRLTGLLRLLKLNAGSEDPFGWQVIYDRGTHAILLFEAGHPEEPMYVIKGIAEALNRHSGKPLSLPEIVGELATQYAIKKLTDGQLSFFDPKAILGPAWDFIVQCLNALMELGKSLLLTLGVVIFQVIFSIINAIRDAITRILFAPLSLILEKMVAIPIIGPMFLQILFSESDNSGDEESGEESGGSEMDTESIIPPTGIEKDGPLTTRDYGREGMYPVDSKDFAYINILDVALKMRRRGVSVKLLAQHAPNLVNELKNRIDSAKRAGEIDKEGFLLTTELARTVGSLIDPLQELLPQMGEVADQGIQIERQINELNEGITSFLPFNTVQTLKLSTQLLINRRQGISGDVSYAPPGIYWLEGSAIYESRRTLQIGEGPESPYFEEENLGIARDVFISYMKIGKRTQSAFFVAFRISDEPEFQQARRRVLRLSTGHSREVIQLIRKTLILSPDKSNKASAVLKTEDQHLIIHIDNTKGTIIAFPLNPTLTSETPIQMGHWLNVPNFLNPQQTGYQQASTAGGFLSLWDLLNPQTAGKQTRYYYPGASVSRNTIDGQKIAWAEVLSRIAGATASKTKEGNNLIKEVLGMKRLPSEVEVWMPPEWKVDSVSSLIKCVLNSVKNRLQLVMENQRWSLFTLKPSQSDVMPRKPDEPCHGSYGGVEFEYGTGQLDPLMGLTSLALTGTQLMRNEVDGSQVVVSMQLEPTMTAFAYVGILNQFYALRRGAGSVSNLYRLTWSFWQARTNAALERGDKRSSRIKLLIEDVNKDSLLTVLYFSAVLGVGRIQPVPIKAEQPIDKSCRPQELEIDSRGWPYGWPTSRSWGKLTYLYNGKDEILPDGRPRGMRGGWQDIYKFLDRSAGDSWHYSPRDGKVTEGGFYSRFYIFDCYIHRYFTAQNIHLETSFVRMITSPEQKSLRGKFTDFARNLIDTIKSQIRRILPTLVFTFTSFIVSTAIQSILLALGLDIRDARYTPIGAFISTIQSFAVVTLASRFLGVGATPLQKSTTTSNGFSNLLASVFPLILNGIGTALFLFLTLTIHTFISVLQQFGWLIGVAFSVFAIVLQYISGSAFNLGTRPSGFIFSATGLLSVLITGFGTSLLALGFPFFTLADFAHLIATWILNILPPVIREGVVTLWYNVLLPVGRMVCNLTLAGVVKMLLNQLIGTLMRTFLAQILGQLLTVVLPFLEPLIPFLPQGIFGSG